MMIQMRYFFPFLLGSLLSINLYGQAPTGLMTDLVEHTEQIFLGGYPSSVLSEASSHRFGPSGSGIARTAVIRSAHPHLSWVVGGERPNTLQTAYQVVVATRPDLLNPDGEEARPDVWNSGRVLSDSSTAVRMGGKSLQPSTIYYWRVRTWNNHGEVSPWSEVKAFRTHSVLDESAAHYPLQLTDEAPLSKQLTEDGRIGFFDFGRDAIGQLRFTVRSVVPSDTLVLRLGEVAAGSRVNRSPGGSRRYAEYRIPLRRGTHTYQLDLRPDQRNSDPETARRNRLYPIFLPEYIGVVFPFRYVEVEGHAAAVASVSLTRSMLHEPFDEYASAFRCSNQVLNDVWDLCKYSMKATSFCGIYVDGDRERIAYEADALINQLSHYAVDRNFSMARHTVEHLLFHPTWPTEWCLQTLQLAWYDYLYSGDDRLLRTYYEELKPKTLLALRQDNGLISTFTSANNADLCRAIHYDGERLRDIVDWPQQGVKGDEKEYGGEADGVVMDSINATVNAFHYEAVRLLSEMARALGKTDDALFYYSESKRIARQFHQLLYDRREGRYRDGLSTSHAALHSSMFPLAFGLVPSGEQARVADYVESRRMACSVYGAQFLIDGLYRAQRGAAALALLSSTQQRSWYNMIREGSTITMEAWDNLYKPNQDWNHAWGAAPANLIPRGLMGVQPLEPGFRRFRIKPQVDTLSWASLRMPTVRGEIAVSFTRTARLNRPLALMVTVPANTRAEIWLPAPRKERRPEVMVDGRSVKAEWCDGYCRCEVGSGHHVIE